MSNPFAAPAMPQVEVESGSRVPPLSTSHMLIWMTISAALISISIASAGDMPQAFLYGSVANGIATAISITALWILFRAKESWGTMMRLPGHWIIFCHGTAAFMLAMLTLHRFLFPYAFEDPPAWATSNAYLYRFWESGWSWSLGLVSVAAYVWATRNNRGVWQWLFGIGAFLCLAQTIMPIGFSLFPATRTNGGVVYTSTLASYGQTLLSIVMVLVACFAPYEGQQRDWLHWLGILLVASGWLMTIFWTVAYMTGQAGF